MVRFAHSRHTKSSERAPPLDVTEIEQLALKLLDMPSVTHRAIVSASGYTSGARMKAAHHGVELYELQPWTGDLGDEFPKWNLTGPAEKRFLFGKSLLVWSQYQLYLVAPAGPASFSYNWTDPILSASGNPHEIFTNYQDFANKLLVRSTEVLLPSQLPQMVLQSFPMKIGEREVAVTPTGRTLTRLIPQATKHTSI
jgi:hypothetical protein